jgi:stage II sporulation protein AA (anti-sigma F factor antagonist)
VKYIFSTELEKLRNLRFDTIVLIQIHDGGEAMELKSNLKGDDLYIYLSGELDEHSVSSVREAADRMIDNNAGLSRAVFNLAGVKFMDSTGIGFLIGRYKKLKKYGMGMYLENPNVGADKILELSGIYTLMPKI